MNDDLKLSAAGANLIKHFENILHPIGGDRFKPYTCPAGVLTIGWGTTNEGSNHFHKDTVWSRAECDDAFDVDMKKFEDQVKKLVTVPLEQFQFDALVSFTYNCGAGNLKRSSLLRAVNSKHWETAALEFRKWDKGRGKVYAGLVRRRASESLLFRNIPDLNYDGKPDKVIKPMEEGPMPQLVDAAD